MLPNTIAYYPSDNEERSDVLGSICAGIPSAKLQRIEDYSIESAPDIAVVFGKYNYQDPQTAFIERVKVVQKYLGKRTLVIDEGYIRRDAYYSIAFNDEDQSNEDMPSDRFDQLDIHPKNLSNQYGHVLICGQRPWSAAVNRIDYIDWLRQAVLKMQQLLPTVDIRVRPHPDAIDNTPMYLGTEFSVGTPLTDDLINARAVITYNSDCGVEAVQLGIPLLTFNDKSSAREVSGNHFEYLLNPQSLLEFDRMQWLYNLAYKQWTIDEMSSGQVWKHIVSEAGKMAA